MDEHDPDPETAAIVAATQRWLDLAVIGLNLCPFARPVASAGRIRYVVSRATSKKALRVELEGELFALAAADPASVETTLLIHPWALQDFYAFNDFLLEADTLLEELELAGMLQIASFHPRYQFADTEFDDVENATNRSPYPTLHLLRETSIDRAVKSMRDPASIYEHNIETMRRLGSVGWERLRHRFDTEPERDTAHANAQSIRAEQSDKTRDNESI